MRIHQHIEMGRAIFLVKWRWLALYNLMKQLFTDSQLVDATGLHLDSVRKLVTWGAVKPTQGGKGRGNSRLWSATTVKRVACVAALTKAGLSLKMAHTVLYLDVLSDLFLKLIDPETLALNAGDVHGWFDPEKPLNPSCDNDFRFYIVDGSVVFIHSITDRDPIPKGIIAENGTTFHTPTDFTEIYGEVGKDGTVIDKRPMWEPHRGNVEVNPTSLAWQHDPSLADDYDWQAAFDSAVALTTVNLSLAAKIAMRKLLGIPVFFARGDK